MLWQEFAPATETSLYDAYQRALDEGIATSVVFFYPPLEGWFEVRAFPDPDGLSVFFRDVSARTRLEEELRASEARYRTLVEQLPVAIYLLAGDGSDTPLYYSPRFTDLTGWLPAEAMERAIHWLEDVHPDDRARVTAEDASGVGAGETVRLEYRTLRKDGSYIWVRDECAPLKDETGQIIAWQGILQDISERVRAEEAQLRLAAIVVSSSDAIMSTTLDGTITSWNPAAERLYGYATAEAVGAPVTMLVPPEALADLPALLSRVRRGERIEGYEAVRLARDGRRIDVSLSLAPVRDASGTIVAVASVARDVTRLRLAERERDRLHAELEAEFQRTAEVQAQLHPRGAPSLAGYEFAGIGLPARHIGGDFYDWSSDRTSVRLSLGDVMGKGMPASLLTATVRAALRAVAHLPASDAVEAVNRALFPDLCQSDSFITLFHASLDPVTGTLTYVDAGHGLAFVHRRDGRLVLLRHRGLPLGIDAHACYPGSETVLEVGDTLVIYSDGLPDARPDLELDPAGLARWIADRPDAQAKLDRLVALGTAVPARPDDMTLVIVRRREENAARPTRSGIPAPPDRAPGGGSAGTQ